jgi:hypothetical protein
MKNETITTDKQAFDFVVKMLLEQDAKSIDSAETCQYRGFKQVTIEDTFNKAEEIAHESDESYWSSDIEEIQRDLLEKIGCDAKCAVGHLISDEYYHPSIEGETLTTDVIDMIKSSHPNWGITHESEQMMIKLQQIHDTNPTNNWEHLFKDVQYNFTQDGKWIGDGKD